MVLVVLHGYCGSCGSSGSCGASGSCASSETQGQLEGAGKKLGRRKVKNEEKSPWGQSLNGPVPKRWSSSGF